MERVMAEVLRIVWVAFPLPYLSKSRRMIDRDVNIIVKIWSRFCMASMAGRTGTPRFPRSKYAEPVVLLTIRKATVVPKTSMKAPRSFFPFIEA